MALIVCAYMVLFVYSVLEFVHFWKFVCNLQIHNT